MFGGSTFNQTAYNILFSMDVLGSFVLEQHGDIAVTANVSIHPAFDLECTLEEYCDAVRETLGAFLLEQLGEARFDATREKLGQFDLRGTGQCSFAAGRLHVDYIEFTGEFKPGDEMVIDSKTLSMTINGRNALTHMTGDFIDLALGVNTLAYTDSSSGRSVRMRITHRDKYV